MSLSGNEGLQQIVTRLERLENKISRLLTRRMDPWEAISQTTTNSERKQFKEILEVEYGYPATCIVTGVTGDKVVAAHIWPASARDSRLEEFSLTQDDVMSWRNGVFLLKALETQFDKKRLGFQYDNDADTFKLRIFDGNLNNTPVSGAPSANGARLTFGLLDGAELELPAGKVPFRRLLIWHYAACLAQTKRLGWQPVCADLPAVPEPRGIDRVISWLENVSPGMSWPKEEQREGGGTDKGS